ncbi:MAG: hypothetical protein RSC86_01855, partial [Oscillospiraceae bacterium]
KLLKYVSIPACFWLAGQKIRSPIHVADLIKGSLILFKTYPHPNERTGYCYAQTAKRRILDEFA